MGGFPLEIRKVFRAGNSLVISIPRSMLETMGLDEGSRVMFKVEPTRRALVVHPLREDLLDLAREVIDEYRPFPAGNLTPPKPMPSQSMPPQPPLRKPAPYDLTPYGPDPRRNGRPRDSVT